MPRRTKKSSSTLSPALEMTLCADAADAADAAGRQADRLAEWRVAAKELASAYKAWCAASRRDRHRCYLSFVDAFVREETAARRVQRGASALETAHVGSRRA